MLCAYECYVNDMRLAELVCGSNVVLVELVGGSYMVLVGLVCGSYAVLVELVGGSYVVLVGLVCGSYVVLVELVGGSYVVLVRLVCGSYAVLVELVEEFEASEPSDTRITPSHSTASSDSTTPLSPDHPLS
ncbi:hypothetical protein Tco_0790443 [Tanacetum coccineum]